MIKRAIVTGSGGLIGSEAVRRLTQEGYLVHGIDNDMRRRFFGPSGSTVETSKRLTTECDFVWHKIDIRDEHLVSNLFNTVRPAIVVHTAAQPSHDRAARDPKLDFTVNANGTLNLLEAHRKWCPTSTFIHCSTSKVYGDTPNRLPLECVDERLDLPKGHEYYEGITPTMSIDQSLHSLFGVSKASGDLLVQEYGRYFNIPTVCFRPGCLTGGDHAGVELHGFLSYLGKCVTQGLKYRVYGYDGLQVRDNIHATDLVSAFLAFHERPQIAAVYNTGGSRVNSCSMLEAIRMFEDVSGKRLSYEYVDESRIGDHKWYIGYNGDFERDYPEWRLTRFLPDIVQEIHERWTRS